ncbi:coiled-coil and C2 domain-containing protein 1-like isoform X2 [Dreissena polymorpha]|uniref:coiled-coil and C2 domain-containing protein 1-like isoform X2 n=1 Tax=Dreissena polymorpha TaxID=45954 RepID=UPI0022650F78|nr:coiled-coil and C2 domain-containing protein 1-like isoform X2 [Dreissena polymorpha]
MFGRKKNEAPAPPQRKGAALMSQMGIGDIEAELYGDLENDDDLEAELMELQGKPKPVKKKGRGNVSASEFDHMIAESMKELEDEDVSDTEDPDLLDELQGLEEDDSDAEETPTPVVSTAGGMVALLHDRLTNYNTAMTSALAANDSSKAKRAERGIKTIQDLLKKAQAGKTVDEDDIPPMIAVTAPKKPEPAPVAQPRPPPVIKPHSDPVPVFEPTISEPEPKPMPAPRKPAPAAPAVSMPQQPSGSSTDTESPDMRMCKGRQLEYKKAALEAKHRGDVVTATRFMKVSKQFDAVIAALESGQPVDLSQMPPPPSQKAPAFEDAVKRSDILTNPGKTAESLQRGTEEEVHAPPAPSEEEERQIFDAPEPPKNAMEALNQRLIKYRNAEQQAKDENNSSKARRMGRIVKQYEEAIRDFKAGKAVDFEELPTPPGFAPIPTGPQTQPPAPAASSSSDSSLSAPKQPAQRSPQPQRSAGAVAGSGAAGAAAGQQQRSPNVGQPQPSPAKRPLPAPDTGQKVLKRGGSVRADQQTQFLRERMQEYKNAAIAAKKNNDIALAKQYLRMAKGFEPMIEASESGLPVDLTQVPPPLDTEDDNPSFVMVSREDCELTGDRQEVLQKLQQDLIAQIRTCTANSSHFSKLGDIVSANKFQKMESGLQKDLEALKNALAHNDPVPKFHYENRTFSMVQCNTDLGDNDLEMTMVRGVQYNPPSGFTEKDLDTYIKYEFPFPTEEVQTGQSETVKGSLNPEYQESVKFTMNRKSRALARVIERKTIKLEIFYKRGFLKSDKLLGTVNVKLVPLDTQCTVHDSYDLTDGRKTVGGKLEVKIRIRDPFKNKQVEEVKEKWLVIDQFIKTLDKPSKGKAPQSQASSSKKGGKSKVCTLM